MLTLSNGQQIDEATLSGEAQPDAGVSGLMRVIKKLEGGDYKNRSGDNGSSAGAYQWNNDNKPLKPGELPSHWKNAAGQYLKDANAPMTPENQNYVAYSQIKAYKDAGKTPKEIDALWNGAKKDSSGKYIHVSSERAKRFEEASLGQNSQQNQISNNKIKDTIVGSSQEQQKQDNNQPQEQHGSGLAGVGGSIVSGFLKPFARLGTNVVNATQDVVGAPETTPFSGKFMGQVDKVGKGIDVGGNPLSKQNLQAIGDSVKVGGQIGADIAIPKVLGGLGKVTGLIKGSALENPITKTILKTRFGDNAIKQGIKNLNQKEVINTLTKSLDELSIAMRKGKEGKAILKALAELVPETQKQSLLTKLTKQGISEATRYIIYNALGSSVGGVVHGMLPK